MPESPSSLFASQNSAFCYLQSEDSTGNYSEGKGSAMSAAPLPPGSRKVTWSTSYGKGRVDRTEAGGAYIDTTGFSGRLITVEAKYTGDSWFCSKTAHHQFF